MAQKIQKAIHQQSHLQHKKTSSNHEQVFSML